MNEEIKPDEIFLNSEKFFKEVEEKVWELDISYIDAVIMVADKFQIDVEDLPKLKLINSTLKDRLKMAGMQEGYLKKESQLPI